MHEVVPDGVFQLGSAAGFVLALAARVPSAGSPAGDGRKPRKNRYFLTIALQEVGLAGVANRTVRLEISVRCRSARMHNAFWNPLVAEMHDLFAKYEILQ